MTAPGPRISFQTKVLLPVVAVLIGLVVTAIYLVGEGVSSSLERDMTRRLATADAVFRNLQAIRTKNLALRYKGIPNEPRFRAVAQLQDTNTVRYLLRELVGELDADALYYGSIHLDDVIGVSPVGDGAAGDVMPAVERALGSVAQGTPVMDLAPDGTNLCDLIAIPVIINERVVGGLVVMSRIRGDILAEFRTLTDSEVVFRRGNEVLASTLGGASLASMLSGVKDAAVGGADVPVEFSGNHYLARAGTFAIPEKIGYVLLASYEQAHQTAKATRRKLLVAGVASGLFCTLIVWLVVRSVTRPLLLLRDGAEAVGRGEYATQVPVTTRDECGELAEVFNKMTRNVRVSREELEKTVDTLRRTQEQLVQREKLSAIGEFVAGVTHELNNPLTAMLGFAELLQQTQLNEEQKGDVGMIVHGAQRCRKIVQGLLSFARQQKPERKIINLNELMDAVIEFMQYDLRSGNVHLVRKFDPHLPKALVDPHQIQQVVVNILHNGKQALESHRPDPEIIVSSSFRDGWIRLEFQDNGPGIAPENIQRIFDPFFTTKPVGKGTGLGLSLSYGLVKEHGGALSVESKPGEGARFIVELPAAKESELPADGATTSVRVPWESVGTGRRVLVVDDELAIRKLAVDALSSAGFDVVTAEGGEQALASLKSGTFDLVICDVRMPGMGGREVHERAEVFVPHLADRFLFMTGDVMNQEFDEFIRQRDLACIMKPFTVEEFRSLVTRLVSGARPT